MDYGKKIDIPFGAFDSELYYQEINIPDGFEATIKDNKVILKRKESDDEKVREALIELVKCNERSGYLVFINVSTGSMIAWLEKQGKVPVTIDVNKMVRDYANNKECGNERLGKPINCMIRAYRQGLTDTISILNLEKQGKQKSIWHNEDEEPKRGSLILLIMQNKTPIVAKIIEPNHTFNHGERWAYIDDLLEKQGDQKPFDENANIQQKDFAPKVETKFNVGEWILYSGDHYEGVRHITKIDENGYYIERNGLPHGIIPFNHEKCMRLWTIQDAKEGDVLNDGTTIIFIFKDLLSDGSVLTYCDYNTDSGVSDAFCPLSVDLMCSKITPATKEQRALFFQKMKEVGSEWDAEKKELKIIDFSKHLKCNPDAPSIIEQKPA